MCFSQVAERKREFMKVGVFDSGIGGITVLSELRKKFGTAHYVYLGDTAHLPYGTKSPAQIERLSIQCAKKLKKKNIDVLVVACNTASSLALPAIQDVMKTTPVFGVVEPGIHAALNAVQQNGIREKRDSTPLLILATRATVQSHAYGKALHKLFPTQSDSEQASFPIIEQACPLLVPMIEEGWINHPILHLTVSEYVKPHLNLFPTGIALLGCTHYPWIQSVFEKALPNWTVVHSASAVAELLEKSELFSSNNKIRINSNPSQRPTGEIEWIFTDPDSLPAFAKTLIQEGV